MDDRISSVQMFRKARSRIQTPDVSSRTHKQGVQTVGGLANWLPGLYTAVEDNINMHLKETVKEGIGWIHVAGDKRK